MERLTEFDFDARPSRSRYVQVVVALVDDGTYAVRLKRGVDFPEEIKIDTVQAGVSTAIRKAGKRARTRIVSNDELVVGLNTNGHAGRRRGQAKSAPSPTAN